MLAIGVGVGGPGRLWGSPSPAFLARSRRAEAKVGFEELEPPPGAGRRPGEGEAAFVRSGEEEG